MREVVIPDRSGNTFCSLQNGTNFMVLGTARPERPTKAILGKIMGETLERVPQSWGTLGMSDDSIPSFTGKLAFSKRGNTKSLPEESTHATIEEIDLVKEGRTIVPKGKKEERVVERFISFDDVSFEDYPKSFTPDDIPKLRLTLFVEPGEGALVYYQHGDRKKPQDAEVEYILPQPTPSHDCSARDRLTYLIPILPHYQLEQGTRGRLRLGKKKLTRNFVLKILTFRRQNSTSDTIVGKLAYHVFGHTHKFQRWSRETSQFLTVDGSAVRPDQKTLFLIHGTMSSTQQAFKGLLDGKDRSWLAGASAKYEQIMGFDHPTFSEGPEENMEAFLARLPSTFSFNDPVDVITHSRGGLVGKWIGINLRQIPIGKGALVACANGVGYFTAGWKVAKFLSVMKSIAKLSGHSSLALITGLAQHSGEFFLKLPGCQAMTPGSDILESIAEVDPISAGTEYLPVVGDFNKSLVANKGLFKKWAAIGLDNVIKLMLGKYHDWVVGTEEQYIMPASTYPQGYAPGQFKKHMVAATHSDYFIKANKTGTQKKMARFLGV